MELGDSVKAVLLPYREQLYFLDDIKICNSTIARFLDYLSSASFPVSRALSLPAQSIVHFAYTG